jgi:uncharacterized membrane protein (DUF2068 family)
MGAPETKSAHPHHHAPPQVDQHTSAAGLRTVAVFEALKGIAVLLLGVLLVFYHKHAEDFAEKLLFRLHIDVDRKIGETIMNAALKISDTRLLTILGAAVVYAAVRFAEAWGLWHRRVWAEWFAMLAGTLYLPFEILKIVERVDWERVGILLMNLLIIGYMVRIRIREGRWFAKSGEGRSEDEILHSSAPK